MIALSGKKAREDFPCLQLLLLPLPAFWLSGQNPRSQPRGPLVKLPREINLDFSQSGAQCGVGIFHRVSHLKVPQMQPISS